MRPVRWLLLPLLLTARQGVAEPVVLDAFLARIDGEAVTWSEAVQEGMFRELLGEPASVREPRVVREVLVRRKLLIAEAEKLRLEAEPEGVDAQIAEFETRVGKEAFWGAVARIGMDREDVAERARSQILVRLYLELRKDMTFVPEAEVRAFYQDQLDVFGGRPLQQVRDEVRAYLAEKKFQKELDGWIDRQVAEGRVVLVDLPGGPGWPE